MHFSFFSPIAYPIPNGLLVITIKLGTKHRFRAAKVLLHILQQNYLHKTAYFSKIYYSTKF